MNRNAVSRLSPILTLALALAPVAGQEAPRAAGEDVPEYLRASLGTERRTIRRDIPLTDAFRRALAAGTRDFSGRPGPKYWQLRTDYDIDVRLDRAAQTLHGKETITVHNPSPGPLNEIVLRLDHNIYRPRVQRGPSVPAETTDGMVLTRLAVDGQEIEIAPAGGPPGGGRRVRGARRPGVRGLDQTVAVISPGNPVASGATARIEIEWRTKLPGGDEGRGHRMTQRFGDTLFQPTQWFPRVAKYDDLRGWNRDPYLGPAEFYNNFGRFDVRIDVPAGWIVSGTGVLQNPEEVLAPEARERLARAVASDDVVVVAGGDAGGVAVGIGAADRRVWRFVAEEVNDFAWATAENYVWKATRAVIPERGPVAIHMVHLPERANLYRNAASVTRHALEFYSGLWAPYPFPQLTLQDGPSSGMEYPMVINSNQGAADHETGHQWWPMMVGVNETWYGWMDEGLNVYMNIISDAHRRGRPPRLDGLGQSYGRQAGNESEPPMMWNANLAGDQYQFQTYSKAGLMLSMLGGIAGDEAVQKAISGYARAWAFKHPSPWDFAFFLSHELKMDLGWFWHSWLWSTDSVDGSIRNASTAGGRTVVTVRQDGQMPSPVVLKIEFAADGPPIPPLPNVRVVDDRTLIATWPVDVWFDGSRTFEAALDLGPRPVERITLDPFGRFPDADPQDNVWPRAK